MPIVVQPCQLSLRCQHFTRGPTSITVPMSVGVSVLRMRIMSSLLFAFWTPTQLRINLDFVSFKFPVSKTKILCYVQLFYFKYLI
jgi:hypothetical protein